MKSFNLVLTYLLQQVKDLFPNWHIYQQEALAFCVQGVVVSGNAVMQKVSEAVWEYSESESKMTSHERRLQRFVANDRIHVNESWKALMGQVLPYWRGKVVTLVLDMTPYNETATIVYLGILVQSRVLPIAWCIMPQQEQWDQGQWEIVGKLFALANADLSPSECTLLADRGLSSLELIRLCHKYGWHYVLRLKQDEWFRKKYRHFFRDWQQIKQWIKKEGDQWYGKVLLWKEHRFETWLSICWEEGYEEPWLLVSDKPASHARVREYAKRMKVEAIFQDYKSRGCFIECSRFTNREHLHRWLFVVFLATWWIAHLGASCLHHGHRGQVDRSDRRDKGLLRIGRLWFKAILKRAERDLSPQTQALVMARLTHCLPFSRRNGRLYFSIYIN
jgi:hypothetical protein